MPALVPWTWLAFAAAVAAPQPGPTFPAAVEVITIDAVVLDGEGRPVPGLARDDFRVLEDGRDREVVSFEAVSGGEPPPAEEPLPAVATNESAPPPPTRAFALLLDDAQTPLEAGAEVRRAAESFLRTSAGPGDEVTIATTSGNAWWSARLPEGLPDLLAVASRFRGLEAAGRYGTQEYGTSHLREDEMRHGTLAWTRMTELQAYEIVRGRARGDQPMAQEIDARRRRRMRVTLAAMRRVLDALAAGRGRKSLVLLGPGFLQDDGPELREAAAASRRANTAVYFVDVRGLSNQAVFSAADTVAAGPSFTGLAGEEAERNLVIAGAQALADDTGGFSVRNANDLAAGAARIAAESRTYYLLGIHPADGGAPGAWRRLRVEVTRPGFTVRARRGYSLRAARAADDVPAAREFRRQPMDPALAGALDSSRTVTGIPLRAMAYVMEPGPQDTTRVLVAAEFDPRGLVSGGGDVRLELGVSIRHRDTGRSFESNQTVRVRAGETPVVSWRALAREFHVPAGVAMARVVLRDPVNGALAAVSQRLEVPPAGSFRLSTPIVTDTVDAGGGERPRAALAVHRGFRTGGKLYCQFEVLGAARGPNGPRVAAALELRRGDGTVLRQGPLTPIAADPDGRVVRLIGMDLAGLAEGPYELRLEVRDAISGARLSRREAFTLAR